MSCIERLNSAINDDWLCEFQLQQIGIKYYWVNRIPEDLITCCMGKGPFWIDFILSMASLWKNDGAWEL